jgi:esterase/lipase superfamily enzyme
MSLAALSQSRQPPHEGFVDELVLAAPDIGADPKNNDFLKLMTAAAPLVKRTTVYVSSYDSVLDISRREHGDVKRLGASTNFAFQPTETKHVIDVIDTSGAFSDRLDHSYYAMSPETLTDMSLVLNSTSLENRLKASNGWSATLTCDQPCGEKIRLNTKDERSPRFVTRFILNVLPIIPLVR